MAFYLLNYCEKTIIKKKQQKKGGKHTRLQKKKLSSHKFKPQVQLNEMVINNKKRI